jgi:hypothetical protein
VGDVSLFLFPARARAALVLNEVLYDPEGPDTGAVHAPHLFDEHVVRLAVLPEQGREGGPRKG